MTAQVAYEVDYQQKLGNGGMMMQSHVPAGKVAPLDNYQTAPGYGQPNQGYNQGYNQGGYSVPVVQATPY